MGVEGRKGVGLNSSFPAGVIPTTDLCSPSSTTVIETMVQIHAIDLQATGLDKLGHPDGFLERQVTGWIERYVRAQTDDIPQVAPLTGWLVTHIPSSPAPTLIHNDFKLNNMLLNAHDLTQAFAVVDWTMPTIAYPLFHLAVSLTYCATPHD